MERAVALGHAKAAARAFRRAVAYAILGSGMAMAAGGLAFIMGGQWLASFGLRDGKYVLQCADRETPFSPSDPKRQEEILKTATFHSQRWKRRAYALARDNGGTYWYVDRARSDQVTDFRLWSGPRGALKPLRMTNVVSDSAGDIFATKGGDLKLVLGKNEASWVQGKKAKDLILLPLAENAQLIYGDLGVYTGQPLGTPCDLL